MIGTRNNKEIRGPAVAVAELTIEMSSGRLTKIDISVVENTHLHLLMVLDGRQNMDQEKELELLGSVHHQVTMIDLLVFRIKLMVSNFKHNQKNTMILNEFFVL